MSPVRYELGFYNREDGILLSHRRDHHKSYTFVRSRLRWVCTEGHTNERTYVQRQRRRVRNAIRDKLPLRVALTVLFLYRVIAYAR
jgi:hypothetical protein